MSRVVRGGVRTLLLDPQGEKFNTFIIIRRVFHTFAPHHLLIHHRIFPNIQNQVAFSYLISNTATCHRPHHSSFSNPSPPVRTRTRSRRRSVRWTRTGMPGVAPSNRGTTFRACRVSVSPTRPHFAAKAHGPHHMELVESVLEKNLWPGRAM
jgi:hypothetical protein